MIRVARGPEPEVLHKNKKSWLKALGAAKSEEERARAEGRYRHEGVRAALGTMFHDKCAYCESKIAHVMYPHIEHFRPKGVAAYRHLAFEWSNLMLACGVCNGPEYKRTKFPGRAKGGPFVDPTAEDPNAHFDFTFDERTGLATVDGRTTRGRTTEKELGLNRRALLEHRSKQVKRWLCLLKMASSGEMPQAIELAHELRRNAIEGTEEYAAFVRAYERGTLLARVARQALTPLPGNGSASTGRSPREHRKRVRKRT